MRGGQRAPRGSAGEQPVARQPPQHRAQQIPQVLATNVLLKTKTNYLNLYYYMIGITKKTLGSIDKYQNFIFIMM